MQTERTFAVIFFIRKSKSKKDYSTIYARITVDGQRSEISLKRNIPTLYWDTAKGRARGQAKNLRQLNSYLDEVYGQILKAHKELLEEHKIITSHAVKMRYMGEDEQHKTLKELLSYHNETMIQVLKPGTLKNYYSTVKYLDEFLRVRFKTNDIYLKQLNYKFITDFEQFIRNYKPKKERKTCSNNGTMKHLERLKKLTNLAVKLEWLDKDPFHKFQLKFIKYDRNYLTERELHLISGTTFRSNALEQTKDVFLFACYTGLSYIDVKELTKHQIVKGIDENYWIYTKREKTNESVKVPMLPPALEIYSKYNNKEKQGQTKKVLPVYSNQKVNKYLKEIMKACKIHKNITFHVARHTFATTVTLSNGVPIETVSKLLGHTKLSTTQIYARVLQQKVGQDMQKLIEQFKQKQKAS